MDLGHSIFSIHIFFGWNLIGIAVAYNNHLFHDLQQDSYWPEACVRVVPNRLTSFQNPIEPHRVTDDHLNAMTCDILLLQNFDKPLTIEIDLEDVRKSWNYISPCSKIMPLIWNLKFRSLAPKSESKVSLRLWVETRLGEPKNSTRKVNKLL